MVFFYIDRGDIWFAKVICLRWHLIAGPKAEEDCPSDARDVLLTVSYSKLTLCCCCCCCCRCWLLLLLISPMLPDAVWLCGIFYINVNITFKKTKQKKKKQSERNEREHESAAGQRGACFEARRKLWEEAKIFLSHHQMWVWKPALCVKSNCSRETAQSVKLSVVWDQLAHTGGEGFSSTTEPNIWIS